MRKIPYKTWLLAGVLLLLPCVAHAAGLGQLRILSALGQPLVAEIDLISVQKEELSTLAARLASPDAFRQANLQYSPALIGARFSIERRANGQPYIRITSTRATNEPFLELLVELSWAQGRLMREYTALIDPAEFIAGSPPAVAVTPPGAPQTTPIAPAVTAPLESKPAAKASAIPAPAKAGAQEYGPVKRGDTLGRIAAGVRPQGVTLEQTLVSLYRSNPDAFVGNMNRLKTGRILRIPESAEIADTAQTEAVKEVRVQTANWNAYRQKLAQAAGETPARESKSTASGKITTSVEDKAAGKETPKEVLKLSKSESLAPPGKPGSGKPMSTQERVRVLEEEAMAREKALAEANDRIAQLEKTIKDLQRLLEIKGQVPPAVPAKPSAAPPAPVAKSDQVAKVEPPKAEPAKTEPPKAEPAPDAAKAPPPAPAGEPKAAPAGTPPTAAEPAKGEAPKDDLAKSQEPTGAPVAAEPPPPPKKPRIITPPPPPPSQGLIDEILGEPLYLIAGGGLLLVLLGGLGYWLARRRAAATDDDEQIEKQTPKLGKSAADHAAAMATTTIMPAPLVTEDVDPLAEADLYLNFGRDTQAEEVLKEALEKNPKHEEAQLKLLQIYAGRKDKAAFEKVARNLHGQIGSASENWLKAAAMGYAIDPSNPLYEVGKSAPPVAMPDVGATAGGTELDFDLELAPSTTATDVRLDAGKTVIMQPREVPAMTAGLGPAATVDITGDSGAARAAAESAPAPDFTLNIDAQTQLPVEPDITVDAPGDGDKNDVTDVTGEFGTPMANVIDFDFDAVAPASPRAAEAGKGMTHDGTVILSPENQDKAAGLTMDFEMDATTKLEAAPELGTSSMVEPDFKLDSGAAAPLAPEFKLDDINLNFDGAPATAGDKPAGAGVKDDHWYDVQTKFDLAKAYQEMGDKDGAREILQEVIKEGDAGQQTEAKQLLESLS